MWNKYKKRIEELEENNRALRDRLNNELEENRIMREENSTEPRPRVEVYLKNNNIITVYDADDYSIDNLFMLIKKDNQIVASIRTEEVVAISMNPMGVNEARPVYTLDGRRL